MKKAMKILKVKIKTIIREKKTTPNKKQRRDLHLDTIKVLIKIRDSLILLHNLSKIKVLNNSSKLIHGLLNK